MTPTPGTSRRRRWIAIGLLIVAAAVGLVVALPGLASRGLARRILTTRAGRLLAPGSLEADAVHVSWTGPTRIDGVVLRDERGARLVAAPRAVVDWNLWQILLAPRDSLALEIPGAEVEIERRPDGRIDLYETLRPVIRDQPDLRVTVNIAGGRLRFKDSALAEPFTADRAEIRLDVPPDPNPVEWNIRLDSAAAAGDGTGEAGRIAFKGSVHRPGKGGATISLAVTGWPLALAAAGSVTRGRIDAALSANRQEDRWTLSASATGAEQRPAAPGERAAQNRTITARVEAQAQGGIWSFQTIGLDVPYARLNGSGTVRPAEGTSGPRLDLKGSLVPDWKAIQADLRRDVEPNARIAGGAREWRISGTLGGPEAGDRLAGLAAEVGIQLETVDIYGMRLGPTDVVVRTEGGNLRLDPIDARLNDGLLHLEPELVRAEDGPWRLKLGPRSTLRDAVVNDEVSHRVLSYAAPVLDGATRVRGRVSVRGLDAEIPLAAGERGPAARARVEGDVLFDDVRFLPGPLADSILELLPNRGEGPNGGPMLVLRDPISFRIAEGRVNTKGLLLPVAQVGTVGLEGSVDFERRLDLVARFRVNPPRQDRPVLAALLNNARFELPIKGTLDDPRIDREALKERMKSIGSDLIDGSIEAGAIGLFRILEGLPRRREARKPPLDGGGSPLLSPSPKAEVDPPPRPDRDRPTVEERKQRREERRQERAEKKAQRRMRRGEPPEPGQSRIRPVGGPRGG